MTKRKMVGLIIIPVMVLSLASSRAQEWPVSGLYRIIYADSIRVFRVVRGYRSGRRSAAGPRGEAGQI